MFSQDGGLGVGWGWNGGTTRGPYLPPLNYPRHIWIQCGNRALRPGGLLKGGWGCAGGFFTKHQEPMEKGGGGFAVSGFGAVCVVVVVERW